jgi:hypothetical protein
MKNKFEKRYAKGIKLDARTKGMVSAWMFGRKTKTISVK